MPPAPGEHRWRQATEIRDEWLGWALSTRPADRAAAEAAISQLYRLIGHDEPQFLWVDSPAAAMPVIPAPPRLRAGTTPAAETRRPVAAKLADLMTALRGNLDDRTGRPWARIPWRREVWRDLRLEPDLADLVETAVRDSLRDTVRDSICTPLRLALETIAGHALGLAWHGQHDAYWIAHYDAWRRMGGVSFAAADAARLDLWATLARSCGWWWPGEELCVIAERPVSVRTEPVPGGAHGELRLHDPHGPAVRYADGWAVHAWHGTRVPVWVTSGPTVQRISGERNVEVRRCAIERIGWDTYVDQARLRLVAISPDPGNPGSDLRLYDLPEELWGLRARLLLAVNGSLERDGQRRRYGLSVPADLDDPIAAAGWTYGLSGEHYAQLVRRT